MKCNQILGVSTLKSSWICVGYRSEHITSFDRWLYFSFQRGRKEGRETEETHAQQKPSRSSLNGHRGAFPSSGHKLRGAEALGIYPSGTLSFSATAFAKPPFPRLCGNPSQLLMGCKPALHFSCTSRIRYKSAMAAGRRKSTRGLVLVSEWNDSISKGWNSAPLQMFWVYRWLTSTYSLSNQYLNILNKTAHGEVGMANSSFWVGSH